jgi:hypothetical protein
MSSVRRGKLGGLLAVALVAAAVAAPPQSPPPETPGAARAFDQQRFNDLIILIEGQNSPGGCA